MTACSKLFETLDRLLEEKKTLDEIGEYLCDKVKDPRGKAIRLIIAHKGEQYLIDNADWLEFDIKHIRNPRGKNRPKFSAQPDRKEYVKGYLRKVLDNVYKSFGQEWETVIQEAIQQYKGQYRF